MILMKPIHNLVLSDALNKEVVIPHKVNDLIETFISYSKTIHLTHHFFSIFVGGEKIIELTIKLLIIKNQ